MGNDGPRDKGGKSSDARPIAAFVSAGSNIEPARHLRFAVSALRARFGPLLVSPVYRSRAVGFSGDDFLNLVIGFSTREPARVIVAELERLHGEAGRVRGPDPFCSRTLDLDLILYGDEVIAELRVPRPDILEYSFVLAPLADVAPELRHPVTGRTMAELWAGFDKSRQPIERVELPAL
jgi:2-amino-4-hydroxy-6-hydroxymethyldihydropteridine diphosphokinase